jgi:hypothetical protein
MFSLEGKPFHRLNQLKSGKPYCIRFGDKSYYYSEIQLLFISLEAVKHFKKVKDDFIVDVHHLQIHSVQTPIQELIIYFDQIDALLGQELKLS